MEERVLLSESFLNSLDMLKNDVNKILVYSMYMLSSRNQKRDIKEAFFEEIAALGSSMKRMINELDIDHINKFNIRESEKMFSRSADEIHKSITRLYEGAEKKYGLIIDGKASFNVKDVITRLSEKSMYTDFLVSKEKVDNLLLIKQLIIKIYNSQVDRALEAEKKMDSDLQKLKEKTFLQSLYNKENINSEYFYKTVEIIKKLIVTDKVKAEIADEPSDRINIIEIVKNEQSLYELLYRGNILSLAASIRKMINEQVVKYSICGRIEKGTKIIEYEINESVRSEAEASFERLTGLEYLFSVYEKIIIDNTFDANRKIDIESKNVIDKAIDDFLST